MYVECKLRRVRETIVAVEKQCGTYSECVFVALGIQPAMRIRHIILSFVVCLAVQYFSTLLSEILLNVQCVWIFTKPFALNISHFKKKERDVIKKCILFFVQSIRYSCQLLTTHYFS
jgi:hypothetical protein